jgi:mannan endo-1,4-beta-mannosidase
VALVISTGAWAAAGPVGGGILDAGLRGEYFANVDLGGKPTFERKDIRVRFDWCDLLPVIGSRAENLKDFPHDNFSVRWTGQVMARFDEPYTFKVLVAGGEAKLWVNGQLVTNQPVPLKANVPVDVKLEYRCKTRPAAVELRWSSPSTTEELVDVPPRTP